MKHTNHYSKYLKLKEQADSIETLAVKARIMAQANRELRKHQAANRKITNAYWAKLEAKYAHLQEDIAVVEEPIIEDKETIMGIEVVDGKVNVLEVIQDTPKRGRKAKEQE